MMCYNLFKKNNKIKNIVGVYYKPDRGQILSC